MCDTMNTFKVEYHVNENPLKIRIKIADIDQRLINVYNNEKK